ncbi:MAG: helix-turn-helix transcriptional regulator [Pseudomonadales bacterium]|nr:helix-turn-helix transcriptional regulator [Pseudomonadales bacterium]
MTPITPHPLALTLALDLDPRQGVPVHRHRRHQIAVTDGGLITVLAERAAWIVPGNRAMFIPAGVPHSIRNTARTRISGVYFDPASSPPLPRSCTVLAASPLLIELTRAVVAQPVPRSPDEPAARLVTVLLDQIAAAPPVPFGRVPLPDHARLGRITQAMLEDPADRRTLGEWAALLGTSARSLQRLFRTETGLGFEMWRTGLKLSLAAAALARGARVTDVALELGYESTSAFISMFKRHTGVTPGRYQHH